VHRHDLYHDHYRALGHDRVDARRAADDAS